MKYIVVDKEKRIVLLPVLPEKQESDTPLFYYDPVHDWIVFSGNYPHCGDYICIVRKYLMLNNMQKIVFLRGIRESSVKEFSEIYRVVNQIIRIRRHIAVKRKDVEVWSKHRN